MPRRVSRSIFDLPDVIPRDGTQPSNTQDPAINEETTDEKTPSKAPYYDATSSARYPEMRDSDTSSIFTQATMEPSIMEQSDAKKRFAFLNRKKSNSNGEDSRGLLADPKDAAKTNKGKFSIFNRQPYEPTQQDLEISQRLRERLGSREEAVRIGGAQPCGFKGPHGAYLGGSTI